MISTIKQITKSWNSFIIVLLLIFKFIGETLIRDASFIRDEMLNP